MMLYFYALSIYFHPYMYMQIKCLFLSFPRDFVIFLNEYKGALSKHGRKTIDRLYSDHIWDMGV